MPISFPKCVALDVLQNQRGTLIILGEQFFIDNGGLVFKKRGRIKIEMGVDGLENHKGKGLAVDPTEWATSPLDKSPQRKHCKFSS